MGNTRVRMMANNQRRQKETRNGRWGGRARTGRRKRLWVIVFLLIIAVTAVVLAGWIRTPASADSGQTGHTFTVRKDDLIITVTESGSVKAQESTDIMCEVEGRGVEIASIVPEGTVVTPEDVEKGKILCQLNASDLQDLYNQERITFSVAKAAYIEAQEAHLIQEKQNESDIAAAQLAVEFGLMDLQNHLGGTAADKLIDEVTRDPNAQIDLAALLELLKDPNSLGGSASQELKTLKNAILLAEGQLEKAADVLEGTQKLHDANYASDLELKSAKLDVDRFRIQKESADEALRLYELYSFPKQTKQFLSDHYEYKRELERTLASTRSMLAQAQAKLESSEATFNLEKDKLTKLERQIAACTIRAPSPGIVIYGTSGDWPQRREDPIEVRDVVGKGQKVFTIPNYSLMGVELRVHESSVSMVRPGQRVTITVEPFPDTTFQGKVLKVNHLPDPTHGWLDPGVKVYTTQVTIDGSHDILRPGMSAKVKILVEQLQDVIIAPVQVVANRGGKKVCYVATDRGPERREVQAGLFNDFFVEIVSGLQVGEDVLLNPPQEVQQGLAFDSRQQQQLLQEEKPPKDGLKKPSVSLGKPTSDTEVSPKL
jgi:HlyD family secretion protein